MIPSPLWLCLPLALVATACGGGAAHAAPLPPGSQPPPPVQSQAVHGPKGAAGTPLEGARIGVKWQQQMLSQLATGHGGATQAWGLFSEGGWANAGQVMIYGTEAETKLQAVVVEPEADKAVVDKPLTSQDFRPVAQVLKSADGLADLNMVAFDALTFEYVHAVKGKDGKVAVVKRLLIRNAGKKDAQEYDRLIAAFQGLRKT